MMEIKYIGLSFEAEVNQMVKTLDCTFGMNYKRYEDEANVLVFEDHNEAEEAYAHVKHFIFSCKSVDLVLDNKNVVFVKRSHSPIVLSPAFKKKRDKYLKKLVQDQIFGIELMLRASMKSYKRRGNIFHFKSRDNVALVIRWLEVDPIPTSIFGFGLLKYRILEPLVMEMYCREVEYE